MDKETNINISVTLWTLTSKEIRRFMRIWIQTLVPPAVTMTLYFVIFGSLPDLFTWIGAILVFTSVLIITYRENYLKKDIAKRSIPLKN